LERDGARRTLGALKVRVDDLDTGPADDRFVA